MTWEIILECYVIIFWAVNICINEHPLLSMVANLHGHSCYFLFRLGFNWKFGIGGVLLISIWFVLLTALFIFYCFPSIKIISVIVISIMLLSPWSIVPQLKRHVVTIDGYVDVPEKDEKQLLQAVATQPVSVGICGSERAFQLYSKVRVVYFHVIIVFT